MESHYSKQDHTVSHLMGELATVEEDYASTKLKLGEEVEELERTAAKLKVSRLCVPLPHTGGYKDWLSSLFVFRTSSVIHFVFDTSAIFMNLPACFITYSPNSTKVQNPRWNS